ncbi:hemicentin-1-like [Lytechinus pictus]|uniref:hemicentin-1-like n=1 Tax=Lytechinus pictus TaxID=7653 RepID=UPI0030B9BEFE
MSPTHPLTSIIFLIFSADVMAMPMIDRVPSNVTVRQGQDALFECRIRYLIGGEVMWIRGLSGQLISSNTEVLPGATPTAGQYTIESDVRRGEYNLRISQVQAGDAGEYRCYYHAGNYFGSHGAYLEVLLPPPERYPECSVQHSNINLAVGDTVQFVCLSHQGVPPASLTWYKNGQSVGQVYHEVNELEIVLDSFDIDAEYECRAESPAITQQRRCTTQLALDSPMVVIQPYNQKAEEGDTVTFLCNRRDKPNEHRFTWFFRGERITSASSSRFNISDYNRALTIKNITAADSGDNIKCVVPVLSYRFTGTANLMVSIITGEVVGTLPPPRLITDSPTDQESSSMGRKGEQDVSSPGMSVGADESQSPDKTALFVILGAGGGLFIVISAIVINFVVIRRKKHKKDQPNPKSNIKPVASGLSLMTTKDSERSLSSSDSVGTSKTAVTTVTAAPCPKKDPHPKSNKTDKCQYAELDSNGLRLSEYQGLNAPPMTIYAEPIITPTRLVPRPEHQDGFHDYALPDILPELEAPQEEYVEPDPPPRSKKEEPEPQTLTTKEAPKPEEKKLSQQSPDGVYIEIIA